MKFYLENGGHHKGNKGDMAILISLIREFEEIWPGSTYFIPLPDPGVDVSSKPQLHFIIPLEDYVIRTGQSNGRWRIAWRMFKTILKTYSLKICKHHLKNGSLDRCLASMMESDAVVLTGGGYLNDLWSVTASVRCGLVTLIAGIFKKPVIYSGHGVGPLNKPWLKFWLRFCLRNIKLFGVREGKYSPRLVKNIISDLSTIKISGDDAVSLHVDYTGIPTKEQICKGKSCLIGFNLRLKSYNANCDKYVQPVLDALQLVAKNVNAQLVFICSDFTSHKESDLATAKRIKAMLGEEADVFLVDRELEPEQIKGLVSLCDLVIAQSFHILVFALTTQTPAVGIYNCEYYKTKIDGLFDFAGIPEGAVDLREMAEEKLHEKILSLYRQLNLQEKLETGFSNWTELRKKWIKEIKYVLEPLL